ncbi:RidA family protein [Thalassospira lucentensis]|uniref:Enamine deaminase RidA n=1 Tax=Thalassospira lucentensis TaxID=168935 RepID=A0A358HVE0_9PROT|nr:RidA family protein [Thalassospira lucentensis]HBU99138.1 enamine deaminase RidA [Thalassospira lucentensis]HCW65623.1 enamine deaminase RidA [Thalassospira lucentensis]|tara:strand:+ start:732 stop:1118 length:387 start_codon:yes stop_codon:yes gene_type:complete
MKQRSINPTDDIYPATPDYIHALEITQPGRLLFISGTMGLDQNGVAPKSLSRQLELVWANIRRILAEAQMSTENIIRVTSYLRDVEYVTENQNARVAALGDRRVPTTTITVQTLSEDWKIEIEVVAAA